jgi:hypothetical protein
MAVPAPDEGQEPQARLLMSSVFFEAAQYALERALPHQSLGPNIAL